MGKIFHSGPAEVRVNMTDEDDFREAFKSWMEDKQYRFVIPPREDWPESVTNRDEAIQHYCSKATDRILDDVDGFNNIE